VNVLLVNPPFGGKSELPPLGLLSLAAVLLQEGHAAEVLDLDAVPAPDPMAVLGDALARFEPDVVGVTAMTDSFSAASEACRRVKSWNPAALTVIGGIHATVHDREILSSCPDVDIVVRGEGEYILRDVLRARSAGVPISGIEGLTYRNGRVAVRNRRRDVELRLDAYPIPAHHLVPGRGYRARGVSSSRGCGHRCTFCSIRSLYGRTVRFREIGGLLEEIGLLADLGAESVYFSDDNFTTDAARVAALCRQLEGRGFHRRMRFFAEGRIDDICANPMLPAILSMAGFGALYFGAESGSRDILEGYRKGITPDDIERCVALCVEQNLTPVVSFILCGPRDTVETIRETLALARRLFENGAEIACTEMLIPYPGTPIQARLSKDGKFRRKREVYYFESYRDLDMECMLRLFRAARRMAERAYGDEPFAGQRRLYREFGCLDDLLSGRVSLEEVAEAKEVEEVKVR